MADGDIVAQGTVEVDWIVREYEVDGDVMYDYIAGTIESDELIPSLDEAVSKAKRALDY